MGKRTLDPLRLRGLGHDSIMKDNQGRGKANRPKEQKILGWPDQAPATRFQARSIIVQFSCTNSQGDWEVKP